jgi:3-oxoacyl-[acyl-carrier-protein] synthase II
MQEGFVAPTLNLDEVDERCAMVRHVRRLVEEPVRTAAVQNFAFGGVNTCLVLRKATP